MNPSPVSLSSLEEQLAGAVMDTDFGVLRDDDLLSVLSVLGRVQRRVDALLIDAVGEVAARSSSPVIADRLTSRVGCHDVSELVQRTTLVSGASAHRIIRAGKAVVGPRALVSGEALAPVLPALRSAMLSGAVGVDGVIAASAEVLAAGSRITRAQRDTADAALAAAACGDGPDGSPAVCADLLRVQAQAWVAAFDQDGAEPRERIAQHRRGITLGAPTTYGVPIRGMLLHEIAAQFTQLYNALHNPRVTFDDGHDPLTGDGVTGHGDPSASDRSDASDASDGSGASGPSREPDGPADTRTRAQKTHDLFALALTVTAASERLPTIGGAAPTLVISVRDEDLTADTGQAFLDPTGQPVSLTGARHVACAGITQRVAFDRDGRITRIGTEERVFTRHQRRAIALRDGGCIIPGCGVPAAWCEIHHVLDHALGGPTHTDNGVLLCWFHHRYLDSSGWDIRIRSGIPETKAPPWWDHQATWRPTTTSPTRLKSMVQRT